MKIIETTIHTAFSTTYDPREAHKVEHPMLNIIFIALCGVLCGANNWVQINEFGESEQEWLEQFLEMPNGIPSHDTFGAVFGMLHCEEFSDKFCDWIDLLSPVVGKHIAIDGQFARGSKDKRAGKKAIDMVSAFATQNGLTLAQYKVDEKSNEITAIPHLLRLLDVRDCVVTIDAMGTQKDVANQLDKAGAKYVLALKGNHGHLHEDTRDMFAYFQKIDFKGVAHTHHRTVNGGHGRVEIREIWAFSPHEHAEHFRTLDQWATIQTVIMVKSERRLNGKVEFETRYYISSSSEHARSLLTYIRQHWGIENSLHWVLDVAFQQDAQRTRKANSAANFVSLHHLALNILRLDKSKGGIQTKRLKCAWNLDFRMKVLTAILPSPSVN